MTTYAIRNEYDKSQVLKRIESLPWPMSVNIQSGAPRSIEQNKLQRLWVGELEEQGDMTREEYRGFCKLHFGVEIAKEYPEFARAYDKYIRPLPYETKLAMMQEPLDFPVTRILKVKQKKRYLDKIYVHFSGLGFRLTDPDWQGMNVA